MERTVVPTETKAQPTYYFDLENTGHLPPDAFRAYMQVLQVLCYDRLSEDFTGHPSQMRRLMYEITVFDIFVVTRALNSDPSILQECMHKPGTMPVSYVAWLQRIAEEETVQGVERMQLDPPAASTSAAAAAIPSTSSWADIAAAETTSAKAVVSQEKRKKAVPPPVSGKKPGVVPPVKVPPPTSKAKSSSVAAQQPPRPVSPVTQGMTRVYKDLPRKQRVALDFHRKIPIVKEDYILGIKSEISEGKRYKTRRLANVAARLVSDDLPPWQDVYDTLVTVYRPTFAATGPATSKHYRIEDCVKWRSLPTLVVINDEQVWSKVPAAMKRELEPSN